MLFCSIKPLKHVIINDSGIYIISQLFFGNGNDFGTSVRDEF